MANQTTITAIKIGYKEMPYSPPTIITKISIGYKVLYGNIKLRVFKNY